MDRTLTTFIKALRDSEVPVSIGESIAALKTVSITGYEDRQFLKDSLRAVVAKSVEEDEIYDRLFDLYFSRDDSAASQNAKGADQSEHTSTGEEPDTQDLLEMAQGQDGSGTSLAMAMEQAAQRVGVENIQYATQKGVFARKILDEMGLRDLEAKLLELYKDREGDHAQEIEDIVEARSALMGKAREFVDKQFEIFGEAATERFLEDYLERARLTDIGLHDQERFKKIIRQIAKRLAAKHSRRRKKRNRGQLDVRKTMRANAALDGVPFNTFWKQKKRDRAKVVVICDVSNSVAAFARFLLMLIYNLNDVIPDIRSFAFSHRLVDIGDQLDESDLDDAIVKVLKEVGQGSTDYGEALRNLQTDHWDAIDRRTSVIMLGDGRSNYGNPRIGIFRELQSQAKRVIWLNPEGKTTWGTGDSEMLRYKPFCDVLMTCRTVKDLERVIDQILASYS